MRAENRDRSGAFSRRFSGGGCGRTGTPGGPDRISGVYSAPISYRSDLPWGGRGKGTRHLMINREVRLEHEQVDPERLTRGTRKLWRGRLTTSVAFHPRHWDCRPRSDLPSTPAPPRNRTIAEFCTTGPPAAVLRPLPDLKFAARSMAWKPVHDRGQVSHSVVRHCSYKQSSASRGPRCTQNQRTAHRNARRTRRSAIVGHSWARRLRVPYASD